MNTRKNKIFRQPDRLQCCLYLLFIGSVLVNIKSIFTDFDVDSEYALVMSYRMLLGDHMFTEMWEPHQTSAFLTTFLMWIYHELAGTWSGIVIFLHSMGVLLYGLISVTVYKALHKRTDSVTAALMSILVFTFRPKEIVFLEFSNMQIGFSILLFVCLLQFLENQREKKWLIMASICLCLQVLSYPSCLIVYFSVMLLLYFYTDKKFFNIVLFTASCFLQGGCYVLFFVWRLGIDGLLSSVRNIVNADASHNEAAMNMGAYFNFFNRGVVWLIGCLFATLLAEGVLMIYAKKRGWEYTKEKMINQGLSIFGMLVFVSEVSRALLYRDRLSYILVFPLLLLFGAFGLKHCNVKEKRIYVTGLILSGGGVLATLMLTNLEFLSTISYCILAVMVSFIPISKQMSAKKIANLLILFCAMVIAHRGVSVRTIDGKHSSLLDVRGVVKSGPAIGIFNCYMGVYENACNLEDWEQFVRTGDKLMIVSPEIANTMSYMYEDTTISVHSTISTPTYDEMLLEYWKINPEKYPNVIAVSCWYGDLHVDENSWIYQWIQQEFQPSTYVDGRYWRFYRLEMEEL